MKKVKFLKFARGAKRQAPSGKTALVKAAAFMRGDSGQDDEQAQRITNDSVAKHREEVLSGARRFIYPMRHSKHRIAVVSALIVGFVLVVLIAFTWYLLYQRQSSGNFAYKISQLLPFPIARIDNTFIRYEEYLFELRQNVHYLANQENVDFSTEEGLRQLDGLKKAAMKNVIHDSIIRKIAKEKGISVSDQEVEEQIDLIRSQGGIGSSDKTLEDTLSDFYGWSLNDLRRVIRSQVLEQKLVPILDTDARPRAEAVIASVLGGKDFAQAAKEDSDDQFSRESGGDLGFVFRSNTELPPQIVEKVFTLAAGEVSQELVETLFGYHIVKNIEYKSPEEARVGHILIRFKEIDAFIEERLSSVKQSIYIDIPNS